MISAKALTIKETWLNAFLVLKLVVNCKLLLFKFWYILVPEFKNEWYYQIINLDHVYYKLLWFCLFSLYNLLLHVSNGWFSSSFYIYGSLLCKRKDMMESMKLLFWDGTRAPSKALVAESITQIFMFILHIRGEQGSGWIGSGSNLPHPT